MITTAPRWAHAAAHAVALTALPSGLWRIALAVGLPVGYTSVEARRLFDAPGAGTPSLIVLSLVVEGLALLALGLVQPWGEVVPRWVPVFGGCPVPRHTVVIAASLGAVVLTALWLPFAILWWSADGDGALTGAAHALVGLAYLPLAFWGPLLGLVTWSYARRQTGAGRASGQIEVVEVEAR